MAAYGSWTPNYHEINQSKNLKKFTAIIKYFSNVYDFFFQNFSTISKRVIK